MNKLCTKCKKKMTKKKVCYQCKFKEETKSTYREYGMRK